jgi:vancomycin permeability regulator SanA
MSSDGGDFVLPPPPPGPPDSSPEGVVEPVVPRFRLPRWWRRGGWPRTVGLFVCAVLVSVLYYFVTLAQVWRAGVTDHGRPVDAIVVMGAAQYDGRPSPQLQARLDHVVELWSQGLAPMVIVTGGNQPGDRFTEASTSEKYLEANGVPASAIEGEDTGSSSWESLKNIAERADEWGVRSIILVSDPFHSLRIELMAEELGLTAYTSATDTSPVRGWTAAKKHFAEAAGVAAGRLVGFDRLESWIG